MIFDTEKPEKLIAPGLLKSHYSPTKPLQVFKDGSNEFPPFSGVIFHGKSSRLADGQKTIFTSKNHNYHEIAANLFSALHAMEEDDDVKQIFIEAVNCIGLGTAIMDRINKAAYQYQHKL
jgi:L-threonylcarbamoyladenylate synthase